MSVGKYAFAFLAILFLAICIAGCSGDDGPLGPSGFNGEIGPPGQNYAVSPIADRTFGILIANSTSADLVGATKITMTSDSTATPASDRVVARLMSIPPSIDGTDGGDGEWGNVVASTITLDSIAGLYNGIASASMRVGYDRKYVYMQVKWTEVENGSFVPGADVTKQMWKYTLTGKKWNRVGGEDKLCLGWPVSNITGWSNNGLSAIFDGSAFRTPAAGELADLWVWQSTETFYSGFLGDKIVRYAESGDASEFDAGTSPAFAMENPATSSKPTYMRSGSPTTGTGYPLSAFEFVKFDTKIVWKNNATIPGYISFKPSGSAADVMSSASFADGTWTVEMRRLRHTGNGDDAVL